MDVRGLEMEMGRGEGGARTAVWIVSLGRWVAGRGAMQRWEFTEAMELDRMVMRWRIDLRLLVRDEMDKMWFRLLGTLGQ